MRITSSRILLLPPKTASRWCQSAVRGSVVSLGSPDVIRHAALHQVPIASRAGREPVVMTRDPFEWYGSWWAHMRRQSFAWSAQWAHDPVPDFREALRDYLFGWMDRRESVEVGLAGSDGRAEGVADHLANQRRLRCGWWSYMMRWTAGEHWAEWNSAARWVFAGPSMGRALVAAGFEVDARVPPLGAATYAPPIWTEETRGWVLDADGPTLDLVRAREVSVDGRAES